MSVKASVRSLPEYVVPQDAPIKLNQNESPWDLPAEVKDGILAQLASLPWNRYPPAEQALLQHKIADYTGFIPEGVLPGCGSNELIQTLIQAVCCPDDRVAVVNPGFSVYSRVAAVLNLPVHEIPLKENFSFDVERIADEASRDGLVFLASPNNPTGTSLSLEDVAFLADKLSGTLVIDEAYFEFSRLTVLPLLDRFERLLILRTFSKAWGLAGLRLGYLLGSPEIVRELRKAKLPFSLGIFPLTAGQTLLENPHIIQDVAQKITAERDRVFEVLLNLPGIEPVPSAANFLLFRTHRISGEKLFERLRQSEILLRRFESQVLKNYLRVTIGRPQENDVFLNVLKSILEEE